MIDGDQRCLDFLRDSERGEERFSLSVMAKSEEKKSKKRKASEAVDGDASVVVDDVVEDKVCSSVYGTFRGLNHSATAIQES